MSGWLFLTAAAALVVLAMWRFGRPRAGGWEMVGAALLAAGAGYAWQGSPGQPGAAPRPPAREALARDAFSVQRQAFGFATVGGDADVLAAADSLSARGLGPYAVAQLRAAVAARPMHAELWTGLANQLVREADGFVTPAAEYAFARAATLDPRSPAPAYFRSMGYVQMGRFDQAEAIWRDLFLRPDDGPWKTIVARNILTLEQIRRGQR